MASLKNKTAINCGKLQLATSTNKQRWHVTPIEKTISHWQKKACWIAKNTSWTTKIKNSNQRAHPIAASGYINTMCSLHFLFPPSRAAIARQIYPACWIAKGTLQNKKIKK